MKSWLIALVGVIAIGGIGGFVFLQQTQQQEASTGELSLTGLPENVIQGATGVANEIGDATQTNPFDDTNPFAYQNPFE